MQQAGAALKIQGAWDKSSIALAEMINAQYNDDYLQAALLAQAEGETTQEYSKYFVLIILPYGKDIAVISLTAYGSVNSRAAFIISTPEISHDLGEKDIDQYLDSLGLQRPRTGIYEKDALETMMTQEKWRSGAASANQLANAVLKSDGRQTALLPTLLRSGSAYIGVNMKYNVLNTLLARMERPDLAMVRSIAEEWFPLLSEGQEDPAAAFLSIQDAAYTGKVAPLEIVYGEELQEAELKPDGTYLVAFETIIPDMDPKAWLDMRLEAVLPPGHIPLTVEEADYIIYCHTEYRGGVSMGGAHLHYPDTRITVHDAHTGAMLKALGSVRRTLSGATMLPKGDTWWDPMRTELWEKIKVLFAED